MKTTFMLTALAIAAPFAAADNCKQGLYYCGSSLLQKGNYHRQITDALHDANQSTNGDHVNRSLFYCRGGSNGDIKFQDFCHGQCVDAGKGKSDYCN